MALLPNLPFGASSRNEVLTRIFSAPEVAGRAIKQNLGIVQISVEATGNADIAALMANLLQEAQYRGGNAIVNFRMASTPYAAMGNLTGALLVLYGDAVTLE